ncbi:MAG: serine/threonine-protein kinase [Sandaracinaceae bacterium]
MTVPDAALQEQSYRPLLLLAKGGMGTVEVAVRGDESFSRLYAVKRLRETYREEPSFREMFLDEARLAGRIQHPNAVGVLDYGEDEQGPYLVMDFVRGVSVSQLMKQVVAKDADMPLQVCLRVAMEAAEGLHAAHEVTGDTGEPLGLVHRDVSPQNLLVGQDGMTRVVDFGIAKAFGRLTKTETGMLKGKFGYMAPELLRFREPDRRSDLFSLGVVLFEMCTGLRLYANRDGMDGARRLLDEPPPDLGEYRDDVPPELVELLLSLLAKDPTLRPATAREAARTIEPILAEAALRDGRVEVGAYIQKWFGDVLQQQSEEIASKRTELAAVSVAPVTDGARSRRFAYGAIGALALLAAGGGGWVLAAGHAEPADRTAAEAMEAAPPPVVEPDEVMPHQPAPAVEPSPESPPLAGERAPTESPADLAAAESEPEETEPAPRPSPRAPRGRARPNSGGVPMWGWQ